MIPFLFAGLHELTLSANPAITSKGWTHFCIALSVCNVLHKLCLDYNNLGDYAVGCLTVALPNCKLLELLDLECTGMTEHGAKVQTKKFISVVKSTCSQSRIGKFVFV